MHKAILLAALAGIPTVALVGCSTAPKTTAEQQDLKSDAQYALQRAEARDMSLRPVLDRSAGYAVFPHAGKGGFIAGGGWGRGVLYENGVITGYCDITQGTVGAQIGGQEFSEIIVFETPSALNKFKTGAFSLNAEASAVALEDGMAAKTDYHDNVAVFTWAEKGLMAEATVGGQTFRYEPLSNVEVRPAGGTIEPSPRTPEPMK